MKNKFIKQAKATEDRPEAVLGLQKRIRALGFNYPYIKDRRSVQLVKEGMGRRNTDLRTWKRGTG